jgi:hypothetical protein
MPSRWKERAMNPPQSEIVTSSDWMFWVWVVLLALQLGVQLGMWLQRSFFDARAESPNAKSSESAV